MARITKKQLEARIKQLEEENKNLKALAEAAEAYINQLKGRLQVYENIPKTVADGAKVLADGTIFWLDVLTGNKKK